MANNEFSDDRGSDSAVEPSGAGRWLTVTASVAAGVVLAGIGLSAFLYVRPIAPITVEIDRLRLEKTKAQQELQLAQAQIEQMRINAEAEKVRLEAQIKAKSDEAEVAQAAIDEVSRKAAESERQRLALVQEQAKTKSGEAARIAAAQADLKKAESVLKQKSAEIERQKQVVTSLQDQRATQATPEQKELTLRSLAGTWQGTLQSKGKATVGTIELIEFGSGLVGKCTSLELCDGEKYALTEASIQQNKVVLVFKYIYDFRFELDVSPNATSMDGTWLHSDVFGNKHSGTIAFQKN